MRFGRMEIGGTVGFVAITGDPGAERAVRLAVPPWEGVRAVGDAVDFDPTLLRAPVRPSKVVCVGRNYAAHARELGNEVPAEPLLFVKVPSSIIGPGEPVVLPPESARVEHEAELAVVMGAALRRGTREDAKTAIFGYACACDVTARDLQKKDGQWSRAKGFDTFCPIGPWLETDLDPSDLRVTCTVNGAMRQDGRTLQMTFDVPTLVAYVSQAFTLEPGDVILTGTPEGVGPLADGDELRVGIEGIGDLVVQVRAERARRP